MNARAQLLGAPAWPLLSAALAIATGVSALAGGLLLALWPDGSAIRMPPEWLEHTGFDSFLIPGLLLAFVIGGALFVAGGATLARRPWARAACLLAGAGLLIWIAAQLALTRLTNPLQAVIAAIGLGLVVLGRPR